jgi:hypothetical protein
MKRLLAGLLALLVAALPLAGDSALLSSSKKLLASGSVTQANMRLSAVNGTAFVDFSAVNTLTPYLGAELHIRDSAGKEIVGVVKAAGSSEGLGSQLHTSANAASDPNANEANATTGWAAGATAPDTFESTAAGTPDTGSWHLHAVTSQFVSRFYADFTVTSAALYKLTCAVKRVSGTDERLWLAQGGEYTNLYVSDPFSGTSYVNYTIYVVANGTNLRVRFGTGGSSGAGEFYADNLSLKQVTAPSATGVTIVTAKGGTTYNWAFKDSSFNYNDSSGYTYKLYRTPPVVVASGSVSAANTRLDTTAANAFAWLNGVDLSAYQTGKHILAVYDTSGRSRMGYMSSSAPAGETLSGSELVANPGFETAGGGGDDVFASWTEDKQTGTISDEAVVIHGGTHACKILEGTSTSSVHVRQNLTVTLGGLYKISVWGQGDGTNGGYLQVDHSGSPTVWDDVALATGAAYAQTTRYGTVASGTTWRLILRSAAPTVNGAFFYVDDASVQQVTDPPSTAAKIVTTKGGSTRGWYHADTGFDPNVGGTYKVIYIGD